MRQRQEIQALSRRDRRLKQIAVAHTLESAAAGLFYVGIVLGVVGTMGFAMASVERRRVASGFVIMMAGAVTAIGLAIVCYVASPYHDMLPF